MTVFENMAFGLKLNKTPKEEIKRRVEEAARIRISRTCSTVSRRLCPAVRSSVSRWVVPSCVTPVFLLDEPLSNLDAKLRATMRTELTKIHNRVGTTFIYVTHDHGRGYDDGNPVSWS